ncbi:hypothetical protein [Actinokineospora iranica]|uniref:Uncharacterized protein n=1 Tax=Actinokineospora iranica TaxID=1271860 RepID=A0A1G6PGQ8_9PSEU|nr:hypothetical protein [Actinokineospora iranica]SDC78535.1 hypothetical protein SAMN05216174_104261 [Actinokineospora iranica]
MVRSLRSMVRVGERAQRALASAAMLDDVVAHQLPLLAALPEESRRRSADYLAELVMLAQSYRHYARGWITKRELDRRGRTAVTRLDQLRRSRPLPVQLTEQD